MSNFQEELRNDDGYQNIVIIAVGQTNISTFNDNFCANSNLPLVMDLYPDLPIREQFYPYGLDHYLVILDYNGDYIDHIDIPNLGNAQKNYIRGILEEYYEQSIQGDLNADYVLNIQDILFMINIVLGNVSPTDNQQLAGDINGDSIINVTDILQLINIILT